MTEEVFNKREKLASPPFVTVCVDEENKRKEIFKTKSRLEKYNMEEKSSVFLSEGGLLKAFVVRKGTQLRLEKALMLTRRILTLYLRWESNACWDDFRKFKNAFESDNTQVKPKKKVKKQQTEQKKDGDGVKGKMQEIRLPSRQWANWVTYLTLRDLLLLSKIKYECERTVGYWLGLISCSHHPSDSLIIVGILSRIWAVSSGMVEEYANQLYPSLCLISSLLSPTKAENWLEDIDFPNDLFTWLEKILGFPFQPASIGESEHTFGSEESGKGRRRSRPSGCKSKMDKVLGRPSRSPSQSEGVFTPGSTSQTRDMSGNNDDDEEDLGEPVTMQKKRPTVNKKRRKRNTKKTERVEAKPTSSGQTSKIALDERWTKFFKNFKSKSGTEEGRKQLLVRIKKCKKNETNPEIQVKLVKLRKFLRQDKQEKLKTFIPKFKIFLSKRQPKKGSQ